MQKSTGQTAMLHTTMKLKALNFPMNMNYPTDQDVE